MNKYNHYLPKGSLKENARPKKHHGFVVVIFICGFLFPPLGSLLARSLHGHALAHLWSTYVLPPFSLPAFQLLPSVPVVLPVNDLSMWMLKLGHGSHLQSYSPSLTPSQSLSRSAAPTPLAPSFCADCKPDDLFSDCRSLRDWLRFLHQPRPLPPRMSVVSSFHLAVPGSAFPC